MIWKIGACGLNSPVATRPSVRGQIEAKPVDVHLVDPVAQRIDDQARRFGIRRVDAVAGAGEVEAVAGLGHQPVVAGVVDPAQRQRRTEVVPLAGVVVDDVQDHLDAGGVQRADHRLELRDLGAGWPAAQVALLRREEGERAVAPVVPQRPILEEAVVGELVNGQKLDRGDPQLLEVADGRGMGQAGVAAAQRLRHLAVQLGEAAHVRLVDDRLAPRRLGRPVVAPVEAIVDDHALRDARGAVALVDRQVGLLVARRVQLVAEHRLRPVDLAPGRLGVRIDEQLARVAAVPALGRVGAVHAKAVELPGRQARHVAVKDVSGGLVKIETIRLARGIVGVVEADLDAGRDLRPDREVHAGAVEGGAPGVWSSWPDRPHRHDHFGYGRAGA